MKIEDAYSLIEKTKEDYNQIADLFDISRQKNWPEFEYFKNFFNKGQKVLDFGCGNGRFYFLIKDKEIYYYGVDISEKLLSLAKERIKNGQFFLISSDLKIPFEDNFFDRIVCLATFHHIPSDFLRNKLISEFFRVLKPGGLLLLSVWDFYYGKNRKYLIKSFFQFFINRIFCLKPLLDFKDFFIPWKNQEGKIIAQRYFHAFSPKELKKLLEKNSFKILESKRVPHGSQKNFFNLIVISQKVNF